MKTWYQVAFSDNDGDMWVKYPKQDDPKLLIDLAKAKARQHDQPFSIYKMTDDCEPELLYIAQP